MESLQLQPTMPVDILSSPTTDNILMMQQQASVMRSSAPPPKKVSKAKAPKEADNGKPKRPLSAYNLFFQAERANILKTRVSKYDDDGKRRRSHGKIGFASLARTIAAKWNNIDQETRKQFDELAVKDKQRYKREMEAWKATQTEKQVTGGKNAFAVTPQSSNMSMVPMHALNAQTIVKCNMMAAAAASQQSGNKVAGFSRFRNNNVTSNSFVATPAATPSARFFFQQQQQNNGAAATSKQMRTGKASAVVGQALALLQDEDNIPTFQPLEDDETSTLESTMQLLDQEVSINFNNSCHQQGGNKRTVSRRESPPISELAAKLDDDCLGFMSGLLF